MPILLSSSPGPNKSCCFQREPPEGCEKVRVWEETRYARYTSDRTFTAFKCCEKCQLCQRHSLTRCIPAAHANILLLRSISHLHFHKVLASNDTDLLGSLHTCGWWTLFSCLLSANFFQSLCCLWPWWGCTHSLFCWMNQLLFFQETRSLIGFTGFFLGNYLQSWLHILFQPFLLTAASQASHLCLIRRAVEASS